jgi:hypothetical protein
LAAILVALWLYPDQLRWTNAEYVALRSRGFETGHRAAAFFIRDHTEPGDTIALMDIGIVGFENPDRRILDISGLTDRKIAKSKGGFFNKTYDPDYVFDQQPAFLVFLASKDGGRFPPKSVEGFSPFNSTEAMIVNSPRMRDYLRPPPETPPTDWADAFARHYGAVAAFQNGDATPFFMLLVFQRQGDKDPSE